MKKRIKLAVRTIPFCFAFAVSIISVGCKDNSIEDDRQVRFNINKIKASTNHSASTKERASKILSKWENGIIEPEPIIFFAFLTDVSNEDGTISDTLAYYSYDEDKDILGLGIREEYILGENQTKIIEEDYPVYIHDNKMKHPISAGFVAVDWRRDGKVKDQQKWDKFINKKNIIWDKPMDEIVPPVCVSVPESNKIDVWIWVYDRQGNKSEPIRLENWIESN